MAKKKTPPADETAKAQAAPQAEAPEADVPQTEVPEAEAPETGAQEAPETGAAEKLAALEKQTADLNDRLLRTLAEYDNYRKRSVREKEQAYADSKAAVLTELLPVLDNFERAAAAAGEYADYRKGVEMIFSQLQAAFAKLGVESFGAAGDAFDPNVHNAVMHTEDADAPENSVAQVFSKGYRLGDRVLRPATVQVVN